MNGIDYGYDARDLNLEISGYSGNNEVIVKCPNPDHSDSNPSACFNSLNGLLFCFSCGYSANIQMLEKMAGVKLEKRPLKKQKQDSEDLWKDLEKANKAFDNPYLIKRGVNNTDVLAFDIRQFSKGIVFLNYDYVHTLVGCQIRQYSSKPKYLTFGKRILFPETKLRTSYNPEKPLFITEGVFGAIRGYQAGFQTLAVIGAMIRKEMVEFLNSYGGDVYGCFDDDLAGYIAGARLLKFVSTAKIIIPGQEFDELSIEGWQKLAEKPEWTRSIRNLEKFSNNAMEFRKYVV